MMLTSRLLVALAGLGSGAVLAGAFAFQYIGGMAPCALCLWQRWPHAAAVVIMGMAILVPNRWLMALGAVAALATAGIGGFHMGVEYGWWEGLQSCSAGSISGISVTDLLNPNAAVAAPVRCDAVPWSMLGLSMAGWNMVVSVCLAGLWLMAARRT